MKILFYINIINIMLIDIEKIFDYLTNKILESSILFPGLLLFLTIISPFTLLIMFFMAIFMPILLLRNYCMNYNRVNSERSIYNNKKINNIPIYDIDNYNKLYGTILIKNPDNKLYLGVVK